MRPITLVLPYFSNRGMLAEQQRIWASYPADLRAQLHVIVVDDCSPEGARLSHKSVTTDGLASCRIYRLKEKIRWNWLACRNLGAMLAETEWLLLTDIDHGLPVETLSRLVTGKLADRCAYRFSRVDAPRPWPYALSDCRSYKPHNDTWFLQRSLFFSDGVGGYDERLSGCYGTSGEFRDRVMVTARRHVHLPNVMIRYAREIIADASTHPSVYARKNDLDNDRELEARKVARACEACQADRTYRRCRHWTPLHGLTPYEEVYSTALAETVA